MIYLQTLGQKHEFLFENMYVVLSNCQYRQQTMSLFLKKVLAETWTESLTSDIKQEFFLNFGDRKDIIF